MNKPEARSREPVENSRQRLLRQAFILASGFWLLAPLSGCTHNTGGEEPSTLRQKQDQTVRDPINKPDNENTQPYDISGGGINNFDSKAFNKDLHNVFDP